MAPTLSPSPTKLQTCKQWIRHDARRIECGTVRRIFRFLFYLLLSAIAATIKNVQKDIFNDDVKMEEPKPPFQSNNDIQLIFDGSKPDAIEDVPSDIVQGTLSNTQNHVASNDPVSQSSGKLKTASTSTIVAKAKTESNKTSPAWHYFEKDTNVAARCTICHKVCKHGGNTTNLIQHLRNKHALFCLSTIAQSKKRGIASGSSDESDDPSTQKRPKIIQQAQLTRIDEAFERTNSFLDGGKTADKITNAILYMISVDKMPLSTVESEGFTFLLKTVAPLYRVPSRRKIKRLIDLRYEVLIERFVANLQNIDSYSLTCDNWTDVTNQSYLGVSIHYVDEKNQMKNGCVGIFPLTESHTSAYLTDNLNAIVKSFKLDKEKITAVVTDSAANIKKAVYDFVGREKHLACFAHAMSHLVPDALSLMSSVRDIIAKVKAIVTITRRSVVASDELRKLQLRDGKTEATALKFIQDVPTRWNSTFYMIQRFLALEEYVYPVMLKCPKAPDMLGREDVRTLKDLVSLMEPVEKVIREISGDAYPTCSSIIPLVHCLEMAIQNREPSTICGEEFKEKLQKAIDHRFKDFEKHQILAISNLLDPRFKKIHFQNALAASSAISRINGIMKKDAVPMTVATRSEEQPEEDRFSLWGFHDHLVAKNGNASVHSEGVEFELRQYLSQPIVLRNHDPLKWWSSMKVGFPALHKVAIRYVSIVGTSVSSERLFSQAGDIKTDNRSRLSGENLNKLLFLSSLALEDWGMT